MTDNQRRSRAPSAVDERGPTLADGPRACDIAPRPVQAALILDVNGPSGAARLWLDDEGELRDEIGVVRVYGLDACPASELEIACELTSSVILAARRRLDALQ